MAQIAPAGNLVLEYRRPVSAWRIACEWVQRQHRALLAVAGLLSLAAWAWAIAPYSQTLTSNHCRDCDSVQYVASRSWCGITVSKSTAHRWGVTSDGHLHAWEVTNSRSASGSLAGFREFD